MRRLVEEVERAKHVFREDLYSHALGQMTPDKYVRYLSFQYHLTRGVQRHFLAVAAHPAMAGRRRLRDFLYRFALEEEPHFDVARHDLQSMGAEPLPCPLDVKLWWAYFDQIVNVRPFVRLGATCVLENLGAGAGELGHRLLSETAFLNEQNTRFLQIHFHEDLPHGDQIVAVLQKAELIEPEIRDLLEGARTGAILYLRMARWALGAPELTNSFVFEEANSSDGCERPTSGMQP